MTIAAYVALIGLGLTFITNIMIVVWGASKASAGLQQLRDGVIEFKVETKEALNQLRITMVDLQGAIQHLDHRITVVETVTDTHKELIYGQLNGRAPKRRHDDEEGK